MYLEAEKLDRVFEWNRNMFNEEQSRSFYNNGYATFVNPEKDSFDEFDLITQKFFGEELSTILDVPESSNFRVKTENFGPYLELFHANGFSRVNMGTNTLKMILEGFKSFSEGFCYSVYGINRPTKKAFILEPRQLKELFVLLLEPAYVMHKLMQSLKLEDALVERIDSEHLAIVRPGLTAFEPNATINGNQKGLYIGHRDLLSGGFTASVGFKPSSWYLGETMESAIKVELEQGIGLFMNCFEKDLGATRIVHDLDIPSDQTRSAFILSMRGAFACEYLLSQGIYVPISPIVQAASPLVL